MLAVALLLLAASCGRPLSPDASGEEVYSARCASCHGADLEGGGGLFNPRGPGLGPGSAAAGRTDDYYLQAIVRGLGRMPGIRGLTQSQIDRVIAYIRTVQQGG